MTMEVEKICRTCLGLSGPLLSIFEGAGTGGGCIADMLRDFTKTKPMPADKLPEKVCLSCISEINRCYTFKLKCENSNRTLRQMLPEAIPELPDSAQPQLTVQKSTKSVQTVTQYKPQLATAHTQTETVEHQQERVPHVDQHTQTLVLSNLTKDRATSPLEFNYKNFKMDNAGKVTNVAETQNNSQLSSESQKRSDSSRDKVTIKRRRLPSFDAEAEDTDGTEFIMELQSNEVSAPTTVTYTEEQVESNENTTYYELSNARFDCTDVNESMEADDEETEYTQFFYEEEEGDEAAENQSQQELSDYNFTIYKMENGETEIIAKRPATRASTTATAESNKTREKEEVQCSKCSMTFVNQKSLQRHLTRRHGEPPHAVTDIQLSEKQVETSTEFEMKATALDEQKKLHNATVESSTTKDAAALPTEFEIGPLQPIVVKTTPAKLTFFCDRCGAGFALRRSLMYHHKSNTCTAPTFSCDKCERVFISEVSLNEHKAKHEDIACNECNTIFNSKDELTQHMIDKHNRSIKNQCDICKKVFTMFSALKDHMRIHTGEKPFLCPLCGKAFSQNANLKQHIMRHSKEKKFKCDECPTSFVTKGELFSHKRTHTGEQPFQCEYCDSTFTTSSSLGKHKRKHTGERPYACDLCPNRFTALSVLKNHRRTHTGEKPYKCMFCSKSFTQKHDCLIHHRTHTGERNYACFCGEKFSYLSSLRSHEKTHKKDTDENNRNNTAASTNMASRKRRAINTRRTKDNATDDNTEAHITILNVDEEDTELESTTIVTVTESEEQLEQLANHDNTESESKQKIIQFSINEI